MLTEKQRDIINIVNFVVAIIIGFTSIFLTIHTWSVNQTVNGFDTLLHDIKALQKTANDNYTITRKGNKNKLHATNYIVSNYVSIVENTISNSRDYDIYTAFKELSREVANLQACFKVELENPFLMEDSALSNRWLQSYDDVSFTLKKINANIPTGNAVNVDSATIKYNNTTNKLNSGLLTSIKILVLDINKYCAVNKK